MCIYIYTHLHEPSRTRVCPVRHYWCIHIGLFCRNTMFFGGNLSFICRNIGLFWNGRITAHQCLHCNKLQHTPPVIEDKADGFVLYYWKQTLVSALSSITGAYTQGSSQYTCAYVYIYVHMCIHIHIYISIYTHHPEPPRTSVCPVLHYWCINIGLVMIYIYIHVCIYICVYIYLHTYIYIYVYTHTHIIANHHALVSALSAITGAYTCSSFAEIKGSFCGHIGLFGGNIGLFCGNIWLFCGSRTTTYWCLPCPSLPVRKHRARSRK